MPKRRMWKNTTEKANFCSNTVFSPTLKLERQIFRSTLFRRDQNHYSNLTSKIMQMCEQIFKTAPPIQFKLFELWKIGAL